MELTRTAAGGDPNPAGRAELPEHELSVVDALLVLGEASDAGAQWLLSQLRAAGERCVLATPELLAFAARRTQRLDSDGVTADVALVPSDGPGTPRLVVNRLVRAPGDAWRHAAPDERDYAMAELAAFSLSWLHGLPCPVRNRPSPTSLPGPSPDALLAAVAAAHAGFDVPAVRWVPDASPYPLLEAAIRAAGGGARVGQLTVLDGAVVGIRRLESALGRPVPRRILAAVAGFVVRIDAEESLIGIDVVVGADQRWWFAGSTPLPDLELGGEDLVSAVLDLTRGERP